MGKDLTVNIRCIIWGFRSNVFSFALICKVSNLRPFVNGFARLINVPLAVSRFEEIDELCLSAKKVVDRLCTWVWEQI